MPEDWKQWVGSVVDGDITLLEYVGGTATSGVFSTNFAGRKAAVKLSVMVPGIDAWLENLRAAEKLSHPHLLAVFKSGRCQLGGQELLYVVSEFAEENLRQVLPERSLNAAETRDVLASTLEALTYLHGQGFVHGGLKPANIMASGEILKLAADSVRRVGEPLGKSSPGLYDAPEAPQRLTPASDIWSLGITLVEVMTQRVPAGFKSELEALPSPFREIAPRCLTNDPTQRPTIAEVTDRLNPKKAVFPASTRPVVPAAHAVPKPATLKRASSNKAYAVVAAIAIIIAAAVAIPKLAKHPPNNGGESAETSGAPEATSKPEAPPAKRKPSPETQQPAEVTLQQESSNESSYEAQDTVKHYPATDTTRAAKAEPVSAPVPRSETTSADAKDGILRQVMPSVSRNALNTIRGKVRVKLKVQVSPSGDVTATEFVTRGPSSYFANHAQEAAQQWKFVPAESARAWDLQFDFRPSGTTVLPSAANR
jgi:TonB family protein